MSEVLSPPTTCPSQPAPLLPRWTSCTRCFLPAFPCTAVSPASIIGVGSFAVSIHQSPALCASLVKSTSHQLPSSPTLKKNHNSLLIALCVHPCTVPICLDLNKRPLTATTSTTLLSAACGILSSSPSYTLSTLMPTSCHSRPSLLFPHA
jgi:hypothetical protein